ncbi:MULTISPECIES: hypothetical protein [unclassified Imperialibacter]|uniref:hypothetical protein n=1 Tax=unclassified Imperialibacter TaxID=2629706 RepID=UPI001D023B7B|nr:MULTISPECIES: hypothetical protein [unclassified Imperialibacter]
MSLFFVIFISSYMTRYLDMGFPTKIQLIKRAKSEQWYINFPAAVAQAMEFEKGEVVEWVVEDKQKMTLKRLPTQQGNEVKKKLL